jgi:hypothetical protein
LSGVFRERHWRVTTFIIFWDGENDLKLDNGDVALHILKTVELYAVKRVNSALCENNLNKVLK